MKTDSEFLKSLIEVSHIEFQSYDLHRQKIIFSSGLAQKVLGYSEEEYYQVSRNFYEKIIHPDDRQAMQETIDKIIHSQIGEIIEMTARFRRSDGNYIWTYLRKMVSKRDDTGNPCTIVTVAQDITEVIHLKDQLRDKVSQLEIISYKNSHLLRAPVASIIGLVSLIEEEHITSAHNREVFNYIKQVIKKLDDVIHEINDVSNM